MQIFYFNKHALIGLTGVLFVFGMAGCVGAPPMSVISPAEQTRLDNNVGVQLAQELESGLTLKKDLEVSIYLRNLAQTLADATPELALSPVGVFIIKDYGGKWKNFSLPGNRIYLSLGLLRVFEFENELAAAMALEFSHILRRHVLTHIERQSIKPDANGVFLREPWQQGPIEYFGTGGVLTFSDKEYLMAVETAVGILYRAGFDPRGLVSLMMKYQNNFGKSPFERGILEKMLDKSREHVSLYTPLRNPIVRSEAFLAILKRIQLL